jgi:Zn-dependent protease with chaperone function
MNESLMAKCSCGHCGTHLEFPIEGAGSIIDCPHCGQPTELSLMAKPADSAERPTVGAVLEAFTGPLARTRVSLFYQIGLVWVTIMMLLLPVAYVALVALAGWAVYYYAVHFSFLLSSGSLGYRFWLIKLMAYVGPLFIGLVLVFFMIKPFFAARRAQAQPLALNPALEPTLFTFIARICELVGAPMPKRIDLDCQLNASASFRRGAMSLVGNDLVLTIGLPLVAGLDMRQLAGVVAHEFGHFTQGFGMRLSYVIRRINGWFARVVYERDAWDVTLETWSMEADDWRVMLVIGCARFAVGFTRLILMLLMYLGHGVGCFLLRQMEYDADSYEIKLAGSATFESTMRKLATLGAASEKAYKEMRVSWNLNRKLPDNFPLFLKCQEERIPAKALERIQDTLGLSRTGLFHSHPSNGDRIRKARQANEPGIFQMELPASLLFSHFDIVARQVTQLHYSDDLGLVFDAGATLRPVETVAPNPKPDS